MPDSGWSAGHEAGACLGIDDYHYSGRVGVFELLKVTSDLVRMKQHEIEDKVIYDYIRKTQPDYSDIYENAKKLIREGTTTSEEVMRVLGEVNIDSGRR